MSTTIAKFTFPLRVLTVASTGSTERAVPTTLNFVASSSSNGNCSMSNVVGDFNGMGTSPSLTAAQVGIDCRVVLSASPASTQPHAIFEVKVPLLVTQATDPLYFYGVEPGNNVESSAINSPKQGQGVFTAFQNDTLGFQPPAGTLGTGEIAIGLAPSAAPLCSDLFGKAVCPTTPIMANLPRPATE